MTISSIDERRPTVAPADLQGSRATSKRNHRQGTASRNASPSPDSPMPTRSWAAALIAKADGAIPEYGSPEFEALPDTSPQRVASCVRAAEAWRTYFTPEEIARRLWEELEAATDYVELTQEQRDSYARTRPSFEELSRRRGEPEAVRRAINQRERVDTLMEDRGDAPTHHLDGRPVRYRAPLRVVPNV